MTAQRADLVVGPSLIGIFVNLLLLGVVLSQAWAYFKRFSKDPLWLKIFTSVLLTVDTFGTIVMLYWMYHTLVVKFGDMQALMMLNWMASIVPFITSIMSFMTQSYFIRRLASFTQSFYVPAILGLLSIVSSAAGVALFVIFMEHRNADYLTIGGIHLIRILTKVWLIPTALADTGIAGALVWHLHKSRTGLAHTDMLINMIIGVTIPTGLVTAVGATVELILFLALEGRSSAYIGLAVALYQVYPLTMLVNLNARSSYRNITNGNTEVVGRSDILFRVSEREDSPSSDVSV